MIKPINNVSFKAFYTPKENLTDKQEKVANDIINKLGNIGKEKDFLLMPINKRPDSLTLFEISGVNGTNFSEYKKTIGDYSEPKPFELKDYYNAEDFGKKRQKRILWQYLAWAAIYLGTIVGAYITHTHRNSASIQTEKVTTVVEDSVKAIGNSIQKVIK